MGEINKLQNSLGLTNEQMKKLVEESKTVRTKKLKTLNSRDREILNVNDLLCRSCNNREFCKRSMDEGCRIFYLGKTRNCIVTNKFKSLQEYKDTDDFCKIPTIQTGEDE